MKQDQFWQRIFSILLLTGILVNGLQPRRAAAAPGPEIEPGLLVQFAEKSSTGYLIYFNDQADLSQAAQKEWSERGWFVMQALQATASGSQKDVRSYLDTKSVSYRSFWIDNLILVEGSSLETFNGLLEFPEIKSLKMRRTMRLIDPVKTEFSMDEPSKGVEPNLTHIHADDAWLQGVSGEGIVIANIDTGVRFTHAALREQYRGNLGNGSFDHNYNWFDPSNTYLSPYDPNGHGTHTMGIMVGDDGIENQVGVAPEAEWIACRGCTSSDCPDAALLACAEFIAAPTNLARANPNPALRPHVVNNSWGDCGQVYDSWYQNVVDSWLAAGIYPIFSNGNAGNCSYSYPPGLNTVGNPARYGNVTGVGATTQSTGIYATFSNWGPTDNTDTTNPRGYPSIKPQVVAPGTTIRSSSDINDTEYVYKSGTSMAAPHVSGLVALMWQAAPCLVGNYATTETLIEQTAVPIPYNTGGEPEPGPGFVPNYATGWGEINVQAAVLAAQVTCFGSTLTGLVTEISAQKAPGDPIAGALVVAEAADSIYRTKTNENGVYTINLESGTYKVTVWSYGFLPASVQDVVVYGRAEVNLQPTVAENFTLSGLITDLATGMPLWASVHVEGQPFDPPVSTVMTDPATGSYAFSLSEGQYYTLTVSSLLHLPQERYLGLLDSERTENFSLAATTNNGGIVGHVRHSRTAEPLVGAVVTVKTNGSPTDTTDANGYFEILGLEPDQYDLTAAAPPYAPITATDILVPQSSLAFVDFDLRSSQLIHSPARLEKTVTMGDVSVDIAGLLLENAGDSELTFQFVEQSAAATSTRGNAAAPAGDGSVLPWISETPTEGVIAVSATTPILITWDASIAEVSQPGVYTGSLAITNNDPMAQGAAVPVTMTVLPAANQAHVSGVVQSLGYCGSSAMPLSGAQVLIEGSAGFSTVLETDEAGYYQYWLDSAQSPFTFTVTYPDHSVGTAQRTIAAGAVIALDFQLTWLRACVQVNPASFNVLVAVDQTAVYTLTIVNAGGIPLNFAISDETADPAASDAPWLSVSPVSGAVPPGSSQNIQVTFDGRDPAVPGLGVYQANLVLQSNDPINPVEIVPTIMTVAYPGYYGRLEGMVTSLGYCDEAPEGLENATIHIQSSQGLSLTLAAGQNGAYFAWIDQVHSPLQVTFSAAEHTTVVEQNVIIAGGGITTLDVSLRVLKPCVTTSPSTFHVDVPLGASSTYPLGLLNGGAVSAGFTIKEKPLAVVIGPQDPPALPHKVAGPPARVLAPPKSSSIKAAAPSVLETIVKDGSFETGSPNTYWEEASTNFGTPICSEPICGLGGGTAAPRTGDWWAWFGGATSPETGVLSQSVVMPEGSAALQFYLWIGAGTHLTDHLSVSIDDDVMYTVTVADIDAFQTYTRVSVDISAYADGQSHILKFEAVQATDSTTNFSLDDIAIVPLDIPWLKVVPMEGTVGAGSTLPINLTFTALPTTTIGVVYEGEIQILNSDSANPIITIPVQMTVADSGYDVSVTPATAAKTGYAGSWIEYTLHLENTGTVANTYTLSPAGNTWVISMPVAGTSLAPGESADVTVKVLVPLWSQLGDSDHVTITVLSLGVHPAPRTAVLTTTNGGFRMYLPLNLKMPTTR